MILQPVPADPASPQLDLRFGAIGGRTRLQRRRIRYPYAVTVPLRLDRDVPCLETVIVQSASGGIFEGERLGQRFAAADNAQVCVTTQAATVVHGMPGTGHAACETILDAGEGTYVEYRPRPLVLFPGARLRQSLALRLADDAAVVLGEGFLGHDPVAAGRRFDWLDSRMEVRRADGSLIAADRIRVQGDQALDGPPGISRHMTAHGWVLALAATGRFAATNLCKALVNACDAIPGLYTGVSLLAQEAGVFVRMAAQDGGALDRGLHAAISHARQAIIGACPPRHPGHGLRPDENIMCRFRHLLEQSGPDRGPLS